NHKGVVASRPSYRTKTAGGRLFLLTVESLGSDLRGTDAGIEERRRQGRNHSAVAAQVIDWRPGPVRGRDDVTSDIAIAGARYADFVSKSRIAAGQFVQTVAPEDVFLSTIPPKKTQRLGARVFRRSKNHGPDG